MRGKETVLQFYQFFIFSTQKYTKKQPMLDSYAKYISCINQVAAIALPVCYATALHTCNQRILASQFQGLFSRITFREPLFVGGPGNTTGLERLPVRTGFKGCIRHLEANEHHYRFPLAPQGDAANGFDVGKYRITVQHPVSAESNFPRY